MKYKKYLTIFLAGSMVASSFPSNIFASDSEIDTSHRSEVSLKDSDDVVKEEVAEKTETEVSKGTETEVSKGTETEVSKGTETEVSKGTETEVSKGTETEVSKETETEVSEKTETEVLEGTETEVSKGTETETEVSEGTETEVVTKEDAVEKVEEEAIKSIETESSSLGTSNDQINRQEVHGETQISKPIIKINNEKIEEGKYECGKDETLNLTIEKEEDETVFITFDGTDPMENGYNYDDIHAPDKPMELSMGDGLDNPAQLRVVSKKTVQNETGEKVEIYSEVYSLDIHFQEKGLKDETKVLKPIIKINNEIIEEGKYECGEDETLNLTIEKEEDEIVFITFDGTDPIENGYNYDDIHAPDKPMELSMGEGLENPAQLRIVSKKTVQNETGEEAEIFSEVYSLDIHFKEKDLVDENKIPKPSISLNHKVIDEGDYECANDAILTLGMDMPINTSAYFTIDGSDPTDRDNSGRMSFEELSQHGPLNLDKDFASENGTINFRAASERITSNSAGERVYAYSDVYSLDIKFRDVVKANVPQIEILDEKEEYENNEEVTVNITATDDNSEIYYAIGDENVVANGKHFNSADKKSTSIAITSESVGVKGGEVKVYAISEKTNENGDKGYSEKIVKTIKFKAGQTTKAPIIKVIDEKESYSSGTKVKVDLTCDEENSVLYYSTNPQCDFTDKADNTRKQYNGEPIAITSVDQKENTVMLTAVAYTEEYGYSTSVKKDFKFLQNTNLDAGNYGVSMEFENCGKENGFLVEPQNASNPRHWFHSAVGKEAILTVDTEDKLQVYLLFSELRKENTEIASYGVNIDVNNITSDNYHTQFTDILSNMEECKKITVRNQNFYKIPISVNSLDDSIYMVYKYNNEYTPDRNGTELVKLDFKSVVDSENLVDLPYFTSNAKDLDGSYVKYNGGLRNLECLDIDFTDYNLPLSETFARASLKIINSKGEEKTSIYKSSGGNISKEVVWNIFEDDQEEMDAFCQDGYKAVVSFTGFLKNNISGEEVELGTDEFSLNYYKKGIDLIENEKGGVTGNFGNKDIPYDSELIINKITDKVQLDNIKNTLIQSGIENLNEFEAANFELLSDNQPLTTHVDGSKWNPLYNVVKFSSDFMKSIDTRSNDAFLIQNGNVYDVTTKQVTDSMLVASMTENGPNGIYVFRNKVSETLPNNLSKGWYQLPCVLTSDGSTLELHDMNQHFNGESFLWYDKYEKYMYILLKDEGIKKIEYMNYEKNKYENAIISEKYQSGNIKMIKIPITSFSALQNLKINNEEVTLAYNYTRLDKSFGVKNTKPIISTEDGKTTFINNDSTTVTIYSPTVEGDLYYTTDGSNPCDSSNKKRVKADGNKVEIKLPLEVVGEQGKTYTIKAYTDGTDQILDDSEISKLNITFQEKGQQAETAEKPFIIARYDFQKENNGTTPETGYYIVEMKNIPQNATVYYTTDGSTPTEDSKQYTGEFTISALDTNKNRTVIKAIALMEGYNPSEVSEFIIEFSTDWWDSICEGETYTVPVRLLNIFEFTKGINIDSMGNSGFKKPGTLKVVNGKKILSIPVDAVSVGSIVGNLTDFYTFDNNDINLALDFSKGHYQYEGSNLLKSVTKDASGHVVSLDLPVDSDEPNIYVGLDVNVDIMGQQPAVMRLDYSSLKEAITGQSETPIVVTKAPVVKSNYNEDMDEYEVSITSEPNADIYYAISSQESVADIKEWKKYESPFKVLNTDEHITDGVTNIYTYSKLEGKEKSDYVIDKLTFQSAMNQDDKIEDGVYKVPIAMEHAYQDGVMSMGNDALTGNAIVTVKGGKATYDIEFKAVTQSNLYGHLLEMWYHPGSELSSDYNSLPKAKVKKEYSDFGLDYSLGDKTKHVFPKIMEVPRDGIEDFFYIRVNVDAMAPTKQNAKIVVDWDEKELQKPIQDYIKNPIITTDKEEYENDELANVTIVTETADTKIYYTINGTNPTKDSTLYQNVFEVPAPNILGGEVMIKAICMKDGFENSDITEKKIKFKPQKLNTIQTNPDSTAKGVEVKVGKDTFIPSGAKVLSMAIESDSSAMKEIKSKLSSIISERTKIKAIDLSITEGSKQVSIQDNFILEIPISGFDEKTVKLYRMKKQVAKSFNLFRLRSKVQPSLDYEELDGTVNNGSFLAEISGADANSQFVIVGNKKSTQDDIVNHDPKEDVTQQGKYWVDVALWNNNEDQPSMGDIAFENNRKALITTNDGKSTIEFATNPVEVSGFTSAMKEIEGNGFDISVTERKNFTTNTRYDGKKHSFDYVSRFEFDYDNVDEDGYASIKISVPYTPMDAILGQNDGYINARLKIDKSSIKKAGDDESLHQIGTAAAGEVDVESEAIEKIDDKTGIKVVIPENIFQNGTEIYIAKQDIAKNNVFVHELFGKDFKLLSLYELKAMLNGSDITTDKLVTIYFPVEKSLNMETLKIFKINKGDKNTQPSKIQLEFNLSEDKKFYVVSTKGLGVFAISEVSEEKKQTLKKESVEKDKMSYTDIVDHWAYHYINFVVENELFYGTSDTTFEPDNKMTRGMFVSVLGRMAKVGKNTYRGSYFHDVKDDDYFAGYVAWATNNQIASGVSKIKFEPNINVTREQIAVMFANYAKWAGIKLEEKNQIKFKDEDHINSWAVESVNALASAGIINGRSDGRFDPKETATRAEVATMVTIFMKSYMPEENNSQEINDDTLQSHSILQDSKKEEVNKK